MAYVLSLLVLLAAPASAPAAAQATLRERPDAGPHERAWAVARRNSALAMVRMLDMTSFRNSIGPRRVAGKRTLADYGFTAVQGFDDGWAEAAMADGSWRIGLFVLDDGPARKTVCITDTAVGGGTYRSTTAIAVAPGPGGSWHAVKDLGAVPGCR